MISRWPLTATNVQDTHIHACTLTLYKHTHTSFLIFIHSGSLICFPAVCFHQILSRLCWSWTTRTEILFLAVHFSLWNVDCCYSSHFFPCCLSSPSLKPSCASLTSLFLVFLLFLFHHSRQIRNTDVHVLNQQTEEQRCALAALLHFQSHDPLRLTLALSWAKMTFFMLSFYLDIFMNIFRFRAGKSIVLVWARSIEECLD